MGNATYTLGAEPTVSIARVSGDLTISGQSGETVTVTAGTMPESTHDGNRLVVDGCDDDLRLAVPLGATVVVAHVHGDLRAERLAELQVEEVHGDANVFAVARSFSARRVHGDLHGADLGNVSSASVDGDVRLDRVGGMARLGRVDGDASLADVAGVALGPVSGDLRLDRAHGPLALERIDGDAAIRGAVDAFGPVRIAGELTLETTFALGGHYRLAVDGDADVAVPDDADLRLEADVQGDASGPVESSRDGAVRATWGEGRATLTLAVNGDLRVRRVPAAGPPAAARSVEDAPGNRVKAEPEAARAPQGDPIVRVLEAVARGEISPAEADDLLSRR